MLTRESVEATLGDHLGRRFCYLVGRGATAIYVALKAIEYRSGRGEVLLPTLACPSIAQVILLAGFEPVFCDVRRDDYTIDVRSLEKVVSKKTKVILPIHLFGHASRMDEIAEFAARHDLRVIEDVAQAIGGRFRDRKLGTFGDFAIFSFGGTKIVNAGGGGLVTTDDEDLARLLRDEIKKLPPRLPRVADSLKALSHRNLYHAVVDLLRVNPDAEVNGVFRAANFHYDDTFRFSWEENRDSMERLINGIEQLGQKNERRMERVAAYRSQLSHPGLRHPTGGKSGVVWRYSLLVEDPSKLLEITEGLRKTGIHASNHYWSLADVMGGDKDLPNARLISPRILNLWVDDVATPNFIRKACDIILSALDA